MEFMTKREFWRTAVSKRTRTLLQLGAVYALFSACITAIPAIVAPLLLLDVAVSLGLGLGILLGRSRICAVVLLVYFAVNRVILLMDGALFSQPLSAFFAVLFALLGGAMCVCSILGTFRFQRQWRQYQTDGDLPPQTAPTPVGTMTKQEFWRTSVPKSTKELIYVGVGCAFASSLITAVMAALYSPVNFVDVAFGLGLTLGVLLGKSRVCAIALLAYFIISKIVIIANGNAGGSAFMVVIFVFAYICAVRGTFRFQAQWKEYCTSGSLPPADAPAAAGKRL